MTLPNHCIPGAAVAVPGHHWAAGMVQSDADARVAVLEATIVSMQASLDSQKADMDRLYAIIRRHDEAHRKIRELIPL